MTVQPLHETVLMQEAVTALAVESGEIYIDATFGRGGHSRQILSKLSKTGRLIVFDKDPEAIAEAQALQSQDDRLEIVHQPFSEIGNYVRTHELHGQVDGVLFDLGVSSPQLDDADRGFSFMKDGPLDMRMNPNQGVSAQDWINSAKESEIADVIYRFGEERHSRRMAKRIVLERADSRITTTARLAEIVKEANPAWEKHKHPATRAFQAIRIFINSEFDELERGLEETLELLKVGGRMTVISFHSLEDRMVKKFISLQTKGDSFPRDLPVSQDMLNPRMKPIGKAVKASASEVETNNRARSAVMRTAEKIA